VTTIHAFVMPRHMPPTSAASKRFNVVNQTVSMARGLG
jgi:hypothetical protein